ncbi:MAG: hypothetical protein QN229_02570 [Desulfurococcaceae archaeon TW002]
MMRMRLINSCLFLVLLVLSVVSGLSLAVNVSGDSQGLALVTVTQRNAAGGTSVYPGSRDAEVSVEVRNEEAFSIRGVQGCFSLPEGFHFSVGVSSCVWAYSVNGFWVYEFAPGEVFLIRTRLNIEDYVLPGSYVLELNITYRVFDGYSETPKYVVFLVYVNVSEYPEVMLSVIDVWWSASVFPGTQSATLNARLKNSGNSDVLGGYGILTLQPPLMPREIRVELPTIPRGSTYVLTVGGIDVPLLTSPGSYEGFLRINMTSRTEDGITYESSTSLSFTIVVSVPEVPNIVVVDSGWSYDVAYSEGRSLVMFVKIQNRDLPTINSLTAVLKLPEGLKSRDGRNYIVTTLEEPLSYGSIATLTFSNIVVNMSEQLENTIVAEVYFEGLATYRGSEFWFNLSLSVTATLVSEDILRIGWVEWSYQGGTAEALPTSRDIILVIRLSNFGQDFLTLLNVSPLFPDFIQVKSVGGTCLAGIQPGSTCVLQLVIDVDSKASPGFYNASLIVTYDARVGTSFLYRTTTLNFQFVISDPYNYVANLILSKVWWGATTPTVSYGLEKLYPLHVELTNLGRYGASYVYLKVSGPNGVIVIDGEGVCSTYLSPGSSCRLVPYLNLSGLGEDALILSIDVTYYITIYGSYIPVTKHYVVRVPVSTYPPSSLGRLSVISFGWVNNNPVYPNTQNATYVIYLINHYPYAVSSVYAELVLPSGFTPSKGLNKAYVSGPIPPNQVLQLSFTLNVGDVSPGWYNSSVKLFYLVNSGGEGLGVVEELTLPVLINNVSLGIELVSSSWAGKPAEPETYGNFLVVIMRNSEYPSIRGLVTEVALPEGFVSSVNNESRVRVTATSSLPQIPTLQPSNVQDLLRYYTQLLGTQTSLQAQFDKGDFIYFVIPINVLSVSPGTYYADMMLSFIDHWNNVRTQRLRLPISVLGSPILIQVWSETPLNFRDSREVNMTLKILNLGTAPAYNVYLAVYPYGSYVVIPKTTPIYISRLEPGVVTSIYVPVYLNPLPSAQVPIPITYGNIPFMATVIYTTSNGLRQVFNISFTVSIEPFIKLMLSDVKVSYSDGLVRLSCTLINVGNAQAQRITAKLVGGDRESEEVFIGDLDPSSQTSFAVYLETGTYIDSVELLLSYRNPYNEVEVLSREFGVIQSVIQTTTPPQQPTDLLRYSIMAAVIVFLGIVAFILYRYLKTHPIPQVRE